MSEQPACPWCVAFRVLTPLDLYVLEDECTCNRAQGAGHKPERPEREASDTRGSHNPGNEPNRDR